jgi:hypothetical protein
MSHLVIVRGSDAGISAALRAKELECNTSILRSHSPLTLLERSLNYPNDNHANIVCSPLIESSLYQKVTNLRWEV